MSRRALIVPLAAAALVGCAEHDPIAPALVLASAAAPMLVATEERLASPVITLSARLREEAWLARFWEQLNPAQQRRVARQLRMSIPPRIKGDEDAGPIWDGLGLPERDALIFGPGLHELERAVRRRQG